MLSPIIFHNPPCAIAWLISSAAPNNAKQAAAMCVMVFIRSSVTCILPSLLRTTVSDKASPSLISLVYSLRQFPDSSIYTNDHLLCIQSKNNYRPHVFPITTGFGSVPIRYPSPIMSWHFLDWLTRTITVADTNKITTATNKTRSLDL